MDQENKDATNRSPLTEEAGPQSNSDTETAPLAEQAPLDARALVAKMVDAGEWPEPELLEQIAARGDEAVEPLIAILRSKPRGWPAEAPLDHAIALLQRLRPPAAIPELIEIIKAYAAESGENAAVVVACFGEVVFEPLLELAVDPLLNGYKRCHAITAARRAAGSNPALKARFADLLRPILADAIERSRRSKAEYAARINKDDFDEVDSDEEDMDEWGDDDSDEQLVVNHAEIDAGDTPLDGAEVLDRPADWQEKDEENALDLVEEIVLLIADLTSMADPLARDLIKTAFAEDMVETFILDEPFVDAVYDRGGDPPWIPFDMLGSYPESYRTHFEALERRNQPPPVRSIQPQTDQAPLLPALRAATPATIRNDKPIVGRNDPCWCGSGKKYKKCHLGKEMPA
jgi:SEC-C motif